jgi:hypothetical protein
MGLYGLTYNVVVHWTVELSIQMAAWMRRNTELLLNTFDGAVAIGPSTAVAMNRPVNHLFK